MQQIIQRLLGAANTPSTAPAKLADSTEPRLLNTQEVRQVAGGPIIENNNQ